MKIDFEDKFKIELMIGKLSGFVLSRLFQSGAISACDGVILSSMKSQSEGFRVDVIGALGLMKELDPRRYNRLIRCVKFIVNRTLPYGANSGEYLHCCRAISIDYDPEIQAGDEVVRIGLFGGLIAHEATHGYLRSRGIETNDGNKVQIERICTSEENRFYFRIRSIRHGLEEQLRKEFDPTRWEAVWKDGPGRRLLRGLVRMGERR